MKLEIYAKTRILEGTEAAARQSLSLRVALNSHRAVRYRLALTLSVHAVWL